MKSNYLTDAINIKYYNLSESDKIVLMYSKDRGLMRGVAKGAKKLKSKLGGRMDLLVANKLMLYKGRNLDTICQAEALNTFNNLRCDMDKMIYASYMAEIITNFGVEDDPNSKEIYDIFYKALSKLSDANSIIEILLCTMRFQLKIMQICGYELQLENCIVCGTSISKTQGNQILSLEKGGIQCANCAQGHGIIFPEKLCAFMSALQASEFEDNTYYDQKANEKVAKYCFSLLSDYIQLHSPKQIKALKMINSLEYTTA